MTFSLRLTVVVALVVSLCVACGGEEVEPPKRNPALAAGVGNFLASDLERKPFKEFTDWEWDWFYLFDMQYISHERVEALVGRKVSPPREFGGLFVYFEGDEVVRVELLDAAGAYCEGRYTGAAYLQKKYACWLSDDNFKPLPPS
jgi:hypothetical protein